MSDTSRLYTLIYRMLGFFRVNAKGEAIGVKVTKADVDAAAYPNNYIVGVNTKKITLSTTAPSSPQVGDIWIDSTPIT